MSGFIHHDNCQLYHITIIDLCDMIITLSILLHTTIYYIYDNSLVVTRTWLLYTISSPSILAQSKLIPVLIYSSVVDYYSACNLLENIVTIDSSVRGCNLLESIVTIDSSVVVIYWKILLLQIVVWLPALCQKMGVPYCIVKNKAR